MACGNYGWDTEMVMIFYSFVQEHNWEECIHHSVNNVSVVMRVMLMLLRGYIFVVCFTNIMCLLFTS